MAAFNAQANIKSRHNPSNNVTLSMDRCVHLLIFKIASDIIILWDLEFLITTTIFHSLTVNV